MEPDGPGVLLMCLMRRSARNKDDVSPRFTTDTPSPKEVLNLKFNPGSDEQSTVWLVLPCEVIDSMLLILGKSTISAICEVKVIAT